MLARELRRRYIDFFVNNYKHSEIGSASVVPENDPTVLFNTAGMQPLVPFLMGKEHPMGTRLVNSQKCVRTGDIDETGDNSHHTFFEMLGNWSLGDYFKKESIEMSWQFLTSPIEKGGLGLDPRRICVTCFEGDENAPKDEEAAKMWENLGFVRASECKTGDGNMNRIYFFGAEDNWWSPGPVGPCGPDTEIFYFMGDVDDEKFLNGEYHVNDEADLYMEIWNNVFMQYYRDADGKFSELEKKNVDTGMGLERVAAVLQGASSAYETELFSPVMDIITEAMDDELVRGMGESEFPGVTEAEKSKRIIADHIRAAVFMIGDPVTSVVPSNKDQGYVLRKLIRRAVRHLHRLGIEDEFIVRIAEKFIDEYRNHYFELEKNQALILNELLKEEEQFSKTLKTGQKEFEKIAAKMKEFNNITISGKVAFKLYDTYGFPLEMTIELARENGFEVDEAGYEKAFEKHQEKSRAGAEQKFKGGLADSSEATTKLHTATHLMHQALKDVLGDEVSQKGSNITPERLRFDFNYDQAMTDEQIEKVEQIVNEQISKGLVVKSDVMSVKEAKEKGAIGLFEDKYGDEISVYWIGDYSFEICGGPHVENTTGMGTFKIKKEKSSGKGVRRIKAVLE